MSREMSALSWLDGVQHPRSIWYAVSSKSPKGLDSKRTCTRCIYAPERRKSWSRHRYSKRGPSGDLVARCGRIRPGRSGRILSMRWMNWSHSSKGRLSCPSRDKRSVLALAKKCLFPLRRVTRFAILVLRPIAGALGISAKTRQIIQGQERDPHRELSVLAEDRPE